MIRKWLAAMLRDETPVWPFSDEVSCEQLLITADAEGVAGLLNERVSLANPALGIPSKFKQALAELARKKAQQSLMREAECRRLLASLHQAGIEALLLKGSALAYWAYPSPHLRECSDIDLLFRSQAETLKAIELLHTVHYRLRGSVRLDELVSFEHTCIRDSNGVSAGLEIDLHWRLSSSPVFAFKFDFDELNSNAIVLTKLGDHARGLSAVHAFMNACMHRIQNMSDGTENNFKWLYDLHLLSLKFTQDDWRVLVNTAIDRQLAGTCLSGLRATEQEFNTKIPCAVFDALGQAANHENLDVTKMHRWLYIQRMSFTAFPAWRMRLRWLRQRLLPNKDYLQARYGASGNIFSLVLRRIMAGFRRLL